jgi:glutathione S-transferase
MKIYFSPASPFVRKVLVCAHELGLADRIEKLDCAAHPIDRDQTIVAHNPLGQVPTFFADDGRVLYDSRVICEYLDALGHGRLFGSGEARWRALTEQSLADGLLDAALLTRYETVWRPENVRWDAWANSQFDKVHSALKRLETWAPEFDDRIDIGSITFGCALGYLDFRFPDFDWRRSHPLTANWFSTFAERPSMVATTLK